MKKTKKQSYTWDDLAYNVKYNFVFFYFYVFLFLFLCFYSRLGYTVEELYPLCGYFFN